MIGGGNTDGKPDESGSLALVLGMIGACYVATGLVLLWQFQNSQIQNVLYYKY